MRYFQGSIGQVVIITFLLIAFAGAGHAETFTVDQLFDAADIEPGDGLCASASGDCTLRAAVMETNALEGADSIILPAGTYTLALGNTGEDAASEGDLDILDDLTISGTDPATTIVNGNTYKYRVFSILKRPDNTLPTVTLKSLTLTQGINDSNGALIYNTGQLTLDDVVLTDANPNGRAMLNAGNLSLRSSRITDNNQGIFHLSGDISIADSEFSNNISDEQGAALSLTRGTTTINNTVFNANVGGSNGGAIINNSGSSLYIENCRFSDNQTSNAFSLAGGGAIYSIGDIRISSSRFENNQSANLGGALYLRSSYADIIDSTFTYNSAATSGGAIYTRSQVVFKMMRTKLEGNQATTQDGGALYAKSRTRNSKFNLTENIFINNSAGDEGGAIIFPNSGDDNIFTFNHSEVTGNSAAFGGGIFSSGDDITLENITVSNNTASSDGGGIYQDASSTNTIELIHVTLADNTAPPEMAANLGNNAGTIRLSNSLIARPVNGVNCSGNITSLGNNLSSDDSCGLDDDSDLVNTEPRLDSLRDNGGFSQTIALQEGSPAIDAGNTIFCASLNPLDQRYYYRRDETCDIGAYEYGSVRAISGFLSFSNTSYIVNEIDGSTEVTVTRTGGSEGNVGVTIYDTGLGSANSSSDYQAIPLTTLRWLDGDGDDKSVTITINDDTTFEGDETIRLQFESPTSVYGSASLGASATTVTIIDDELPGEAFFTSTDYRVDESDRYASILVERANGNTPVSIDYATSDDSAVAGTDYTSATGTLNFGRGVNSKIFRIYVTNNTLADGDRTINLTLSNPKDGLTLGSPATAVLTIQDDESTPVEPGAISIEYATYSVNENAGTLTVTLVRSGGRDGDVSVDLVLQDGSAIFSSDYSALENGLATRTLTISFSEGERTRNASIIINNDSTFEETETFSISVNNPQGGASLGTQSSATVTIIDNDQPVESNPANHQAANGNGDAANNAAGAIHPGFLLALLLAGSAWRRRPSIG